MVAYLHSVPAIASGDLPATLAPPAPASHKDGVGTLDPAPKNWCFRAPALRAATGISESPLPAFATLTGGWAVNDPGSTNVAQIGHFSGPGGTPRGTPSPLRQRLLRRGDRRRSNATEHMD